jgi:xanthine dehydrogenase accessory factor
LKLCYDALVPFRPSAVIAEILAVKNGVALPRDMEVAQAKNLRAVEATSPAGVVCGTTTASLP